jgi:hypothetical protein
VLKETNTMETLITCTGNSHGDIMNFDNLINKLEAIENEGTLELANHTARILRDPYTLGHHGEELVQAAAKVAQAREFLVDAREAQRNKIALGRGVGTVGMLLAQWQLNALRIAAISDLRCSSPMDTMMLNAKNAVACHLLWQIAH